MQIQYVQDLPLFPGYKVRSNMLILNYHVGNQHGVSGGGGTTQSSLRRGFAPSSNPLLFVHHFEKKCPKNNIQTAVTNMTKQHML